MKKYLAVDEKTRGMMRRYTPFHQNVMELERQVRSINNKEGTNLVITVREEK